MHRITAVTLAVALAFAPVLAGCGSSSSAQPAKTVTVTASAEATSPSAAAATSAPATPSSSETGDVAPGVFVFGKTSTITTDIPVTVTIDHTEPMTSDEAEFKTAEMAAKDIYLNAKITNNTKHAIRPSTITPTAMIQGGDAGCYATEWEGKASILPGATKTLEFTCEADKDGKLTVMLETDNNTGFFGSWSNEDPKYLNANE
ncbi:hypothetical protein [Acidipropionibacterium jensenii]|uniref:DUF4352 domain-containing protein n=1 Tax=Acidipropionibacterium jensenii TaxID=1749 RepID=A0A3S4WWR6_9ACTN|nr:hypothetical protein [Acidipropionibacterium jensenii]MDN6555772.1 hypothetical protein [Acidipropionibacterium acidipropionici]MDN5977425.1 hypothetical protein [Acidipropionibacterium jensenii]MDN5997285.1 hypothetical protein [Acidipropionibacterium jensenii]MDN6020643.1 hypothetical protein [Acidipropionibacterium jensenii]MDN6426701.1 hypothetical protein [Acidipropionibacterium jensenii]